MHVDGHPCFFPDDLDPTKMSAPGTGKLLRYLVPDGGRAVEGVAYCEIEVMKTVMPLMATSTGVVAHQVQPGSALETGDELCAVAVEDPSAVKVSQPFTRRVHEFEDASSPARSKDDSALVRFNVNSTGSSSSSPGTTSTRRRPGDAAARGARHDALAVDDFSETKQAVSRRAESGARRARRDRGPHDARRSGEDDGGRRRGHTDVVSVAVRASRPHRRARPGLSAAARVRGAVRRRSAHEPRAEC